MTHGSVKVVEFDHAATMDRDELFAWGERLREEAPIAWSEAHGGVWVISRHQDICAIARDTEHFLSGHGVTVPPLKSPVPVIPAESDPPNHTHYRAALASFLTPKEVRKKEAKIREIIVEALDTLIAKGGGDAVADFAAKIPARAMAYVFGFEDEDAYRFDHDFTEVVNAATSNDVERQTRAVENFVTFLNEKLDQRRGDPTDHDLVSAILAYDNKGKTFDDNEALGLVWSAAGGAVDTTKHAIGHALYRLGNDKELRQRIIDDPSLLMTLPDEILRMDSPAFVGARYVAKDVEFGGVQMKEGQRLLMMWGWGSRDGEEFEDADTLDPARKYNRHLAFGHGYHQCIGMHLAKMEIRIAIEEVLGRMPDYELVDPAMQPRIRGGLMWSFDKLPIRV